MESKIPVKPLNFTSVVEKIVFITVNRLKKGFQLGAGRAKRHAPETRFLLTLPILSFLAPLLALALALAPLLALVFHHVIHHLPAVPPPSLLDPKEIYQ